MANRETILEQIRQKKPGASPLPVQFNRRNKPLLNEDLAKLFRESLVKAGAEVVELSNQEDILAYLDKKVAGAIDFRQPEIRTRYSSNTSNDDLEKIGAAVVEGRFGVSENGAVWFDETDFPNRLIPFITEQLIIVLNTGNIVRDMHEAYQKIDLKDTGFGVFISGPSKTADIEQSLVYGAHGAKELCVLLY